MYQNIGQPHLQYGLRSVPGSVHINVRNFKDIILNMKLKLQSKCKGVNINVKA